MNRAPVILSKAGLAARLGKTPKVIDRWTTHGGCPVIRIPGSRPCFDLDAVLQWLRRHSGTGPKPKAEPVRRIPRRVRNDREAAQAAIQSLSP